MSTKFGKLRCARQREFQNIDIPVDPFRVNVALYAIFS
jgi:hypothetical protein